MVSWALVSSSAGRSGSPQRSATVRPHHRDHVLAGLQRAVVLEQRHRGDGEAGVGRLQHADVDLPGEQRLERRARVGMLRTAPNRIP